MNFSEITCVTVGKVPFQRESEILPEVHRNVIQELFPLFGSGHMNNTMKGAFIVVPLKFVIPFIENSSYF